MNAPTPLADRPYETEIHDEDGDLIATVFHHGDKVSVSPYRSTLEMDHREASRMAAALIACY